MAEKGKRSPTGHRTPEQRKKAQHGYDKRPDQMANRRARMRARYQLEKEGKVKKGDGKDVAHKKPLSKGGSNKRTNLEVQSRAKNRGWERQKSGKNKPG
jgi:hypothetical protein